MPKWVQRFYEQIVQGLLLLVPIVVVIVLQLLDTFDFWMNERGENLEGLGFWVEYGSIRVVIAIVALAMYLLLGWYISEYSPYQERQEFNPKGSKNLDVFTSWMSYLVLYICYIEILIRIVSGISLPY